MAIPHPGPEGHNALAHTDPPAPDVAFLILSHTEPELLDRLVARLSQDFSVYLHIDSAASFRAQDFSWAPRVTSVPSRRTYWGSFDVTRAILDLLRTAREGNHSHYVLISGQDLPLKSNADITSFFGAQNSTDFIRTVRMPYEGIGGGMERLTRMHWHAFYRYRGARRFIYQGWELLMAVGYKTVLQEKVLAGEFYHGETWFALRCHTLDHVFSYLDTHPEYQELFSGSRLAEESFLQSIIRRLNPAGHDIEDTMTFMDWHSGPESPRVLDESDVPRLETTDKLFARKISSGKSRALIDHFYAATGTTHQGPGAEHPSASTAEGDRRGS